MRAEFSIQTRLISLDGTARLRPLRHVIGVLAASVALTASHAHAAERADLALDPSTIPTMPAQSFGGATGGIRPATGVSAHLQRYSDYYTTKTGDTRDYWDATRQSAALTERTNDLRLAKELGMVFVRTDYNWNWVEGTKGTYAFTGRDPFYDFERIAREVDAAGMSTMFILAYANELYGGPSYDQSGLRGITTAEERAAFVNFATATARNFSKFNMRYEVWNEPNFSFFWKNPDVAAFSQLAREATAAIKGIDPRLEVITGGVWLNDENYMRGVADNALSTGADYGMHPYRAVPESILGEETEPFSSSYRFLRGAITNAKSTAPLAVTEDGYSSRAKAWHQSTWTTKWNFDNSANDGISVAGRRQQAVFGLRSYLAHWMAGVKTYTWYDLRDGGKSPTEEEQNFGLLDVNGQPKPIYNGLKRLLTLTNARVMTGQRSDRATGFNRVAFGADLFMMWLENPTISKRVAVPANATVTELISGQTLAQTPCEQSSGATASCVTLAGIAGPVAVQVSTAGQTCRI
jgi:Cellulase (glycosyl hydrolase family 5)